MDCEHVLSLCTTYVLPVTHHSVSVSTICNLQRLTGLTWQMLQAFKLLRWLIRDSKALHHGASTDANVVHLSRGVPAFHDLPTA